MRKIGVLLVVTVFASGAAADLLYDNGPLITLDKAREPGMGSRVITDLSCTRLAAHNKARHISPDTATISHHLDH